MERKDYPFRTRSWLAQGWSRAQGGGFYADTSVPGTSVHACLFLSLRLSDQSVTTCVQSRATLCVLFSCSYVLVRRKLVLKLLNFIFFFFFFC